ncbi:MAG TPA: SIS domain-containing protein [Pilimelia sp.]|nr:SIS domain-containing protein [Pilimelia sp.]
MARDPHAILDDHLTALAAALLPFRRVAGPLSRWGSDLAWTLGNGGRLLTAGNGGSAAEAQHLTAELVGKLRDDRTPLSAIALCAETSSLTAISNDYGFEEVYARQVRAHGRPDDILLLMSTSGCSPNLLAAAEAGRESGLRVWGFTGPAPNPLAERCDQVLAVPSPESQVVQELHLLAVHLLCEYVDLTLPMVLGVADAYAGKAAPADVPAGPVAESPVGAQTTSGNGARLALSNGNGPRP